MGEGLNFNQKNQEAKQSASAGQPAGASPARAGDRPASPVGRSADVPPKKIKKFRFFSRHIGTVKTMQDDIAGLIVNKNHQGKNNSKSAGLPTRQTGWPALPVGRPTYPVGRRDIQRNLAEVYTDGDGKIPDLTKLDKSQRPYWKTVLYILSAVLAVLLVAGVAGYYVFNNLNNNRAFTNEKITLKIETPITIVSGQEMTYLITINNQERVNLYNAELQVFYPDDFQYVSAEPAPLSDQKNIWDYTVIESGETQTIKITAKIIAPLNSTQTLKATLTFKPENMNATFKQEAIVDAAVLASNINLELVGPDKILANQQAEYNLKYKNTSDQDLSDLQLVIDYPPGFIFNSADPEPQTDNGNNNIWAIPNLKAGAEGEIKVRGDYSATAEGGNREFKARIQLKQNNDYYPQSEASLVTTVIKDQLSLQLIINGSAEDQPINFEDLLVYSLNFKNVGQDDLTNIKLIANLNSQILDWGTLKDDHHGAVSQNTITWTGRQVSKLLKLAPGEEGQIVWTIKVKDSSVINDKNISKFSVESYINGEATQSGGAGLPAQAGGKSTVQSQTVTNAINSDLGLSAAARYYNEDNLALGAGPIQPTAGEKSSYNIRLELANNLHEVKDLIVVATLPNGVDFDGQENHTAGNVNYNAQSKKVTWTISRLAKSASKVEVTFNVGLMPKDADLGKVLVLISGVNLSGQDAQTGAAINQSLKAITTAFSDPILGQVSGIVK